MSHNKGIQVEKYITKLFKGKRLGHKIDHYDVETKNMLLEVKSYELINKYKRETFKRGFTHHLGRFQIKIKNHAHIFLEAIKLGKTPKYVFVTEFHNRKFFTTMNWQDVDRLCFFKKKIAYIKVTDIFCK